MVDEPEENRNEARITPGAAVLIESARKNKQINNHDELGLNHWLLAALERHAAMAETVCRITGTKELKKHIRSELSKGQTGEPAPEEEILEEAIDHAQSRGKSQATERDILYVVLTRAGYEPIEEPAPPEVPLEVAGDEHTEEKIKEQGTTQEAVTGYKSRVRLPTPTLDKLGRDITREALEGKLSPMVGREEEIQSIIETLCRRTKRNPVLVGPAGVGKTAIVEGLAQKIVRGEVSKVLQGARIISLRPSAVFMNISSIGELEERIKAILADASQDGVILFIDEVHTIMGVTIGPAADVGNMLKQALSRGDIACIAATTDDEYRRFIEQDSALERRFQPIRIQELTADQTIDVMQAHRDLLARIRNVTVSDDVLRWLVDFAQEFLRNRYFPDKGIDLLETCVAHAVANSKSSVEPADAEEVAKRLIGMPTAPGERVAALAEKVAQTCPLRPEDIDKLVGHLQVTVRGLDVRRTRANAVILLIDKTVEQSEVLSRAIAEGLFGAPNRVISMDLSPLQHEADVTRLTGSSPGYVGYSDALPLHQLAQMPWCVLIFENIHACHPAVVEVIAQALAQGYFTLSPGKKVYLSDAVVILTADIARSKHCKLGFGRPGESAESWDDSSLADELGRSLLDEVDMVFADTITSEAQLRDWIEQLVLGDLSQRYRKHGLVLSFDESFTDWLLSQRHSRKRLRDWERLLDERLTPLLIPFVSGVPGKEADCLLVSCANGEVQVKPLKHMEKEKTDDPVQDKTP